MLDVDAAGALANSAKIVAYFATFDEKGLVDALAKVVSDSENDPSVISISWGWDENENFNNSGVIWSPAAIAHCNASFLAAAHLGITVCVSTGDDGAEAQMQDGRAHVNYPATSPYVLAVGGTTLHVRKNASGAKQITETVWNDRGAAQAAASATSRRPRPGRTARWSNRSTRAFRGPGDSRRRGRCRSATGYLTKSNGKLTVVGGTSASAPLWASLIARINVMEQTGRRLQRAALQQVRSEQRAARHHRRQQ